MKLIEIVSGIWVEDLGYWFDPFGRPVFETDEEKRKRYGLGSGSCSFTVAGPAAAEEFWAIIRQSESEFNR
jgi:hypothetical protein